LTVSNNDAKVLGTEEYKEWTKWNIKKFAEEFRQ